MINKLRTSTGWLARETVKGLPEAGKKVGGAIGKIAGGIMKAPFSAAKRGIKRINKPEPALSPEEIKERKSNIDKLKKTHQEYIKKHPKFKTPREFRDLE